MPLCLVTLTLLIAARSAKAKPIEAAAEGNPWQDGGCGLRLRLSLLRPLQEAWGPIPRPTKTLAQMIPLRIPQQVRDRRCCSPKRILM